jgi:hypothetical protein
MIINGCMLHEKGDARWISFPAKEYTDNQGQKQFARFVEFTDKRIADRFRDLTLQALDRYFHEVMNEQQQQRV